MTTVFVSDEFIAKEAALQYFNRFGSVPIQVRVTDSKVVPIRSHQYPINPHTLDARRAGALNREHSGSGLDRDQYFEQIRSVIEGCIPPIPARDAFFRVLNMGGEE